MTTSRKRTTNGRMRTWIWTESMVHATLRKSYTLIRLSFNVIQCYMMSCMTPQYDDYVWLFMIYVWGCMMRDDIKWCIHTYDEYMICLMYDIIWILNDSYGIWRAYATHLNDVYDIAWVLMIHMLYDMCMLRNSNGRIMICIWDGASLWCWMRFVCDGVSIWRVYATSEWMSMKI